MICEFPIELADPNEESDHLPAQQGWGVFVQRVGEAPTPELSWVHEDREVAELFIEHHSDTATRWIGEVVRTRLVPGTEETPRHAMYQRCLPLPDALNRPDAGKWQSANLRALDWF